MERRYRRLALAAALVIPVSTHAQQPVQRTGPTTAVTSDRLVRAADEPHNWLTYSGGYHSQRYSTLTQIDRANVKDLELAWILPNQVFGAWQSTPLVVDG